MGEQQRRIYVLMPFRDDLNRVYETIHDAAESMDYDCGRSDKILSHHFGDILERIIRGIDDADVVIADLTDNNLNVFWELGVANGLSRECLMITQNSHEELPFNLRNFDVIHYKNNYSGLQDLKKKIVEIVKPNELIQSPVNKNLDKQLNGRRTAIYVLSGALAGPLLSFIPSLAPASIGASFMSYYQGEGNFFREVLGGAPAAFFGGALTFGAYAIVFNKYRPELRRRVLVLSETLAGFTAGVITFAFTFLLDVKKFGPEIALGTSTPYLIMFTIGAIGFGLSLNVQPLRAKRDPLISHVTKTVLALFVSLAAFLAIINLLRNQIFFPAYLEHYKVLDSVGDALRYFFWGILLSTFHWCLKWLART
jgi:hypothetical protein